MIPFLGVQTWKSECSQKNKWHQNSTFFGHHFGAIYQKGTVFETQSYKNNFPCFSH